MIWRIITGLFVIIAGIGGIIKCDDRYAKCDDTKQCLNKMEVTIVQTFEKFQQTQDVRQYDIRQESLDRDLKNCRRDQQVNPNDSSLAEECNDIKREKERMRIQKEELMKKLMGG
jgi:hypothetical protein